MTRASKRKRTPVTASASAVPALPGPASAGTVAKSSLWPYALILAVACLVLLPRLGDYGFWDPWEPKYAESVREMIERDSLVVPYYRDEVRLTKPILVYWGIRAGATVFGLNELGARIGGVTFAMVAMLAVYYALSILRGRRAGLLAALILGTCPQFFFLARHATPDIYLLTSLGCALLFFALGLFGPPRRRDIHFFVAYGCFALAVLAKGPIVAGVVCLTTVALYATARLDFPRLCGPELRWETARAVVLSVAGGGALAACSGVAFLFGTSSQWWGYSAEGREELGDLREGLGQALAGTGLPEIVLVGFTAACALGAFALYRKRARSARAMAGILAAAAALAVATAVLGGTETRLLVASVAGSAAGTALLFWAIRHFVTLPAVWPDAGPLLRPIGRQLALFALVFVAVAGPWHVAIFIEQGHGYVTDFIMKHNLERIGEEINNSGGADFYLRTMIFGMFPWSCLIPIALGAAVSWWERDVLQKYGPEVLMLIASAVTFFAFSASVTKFTHYLAPILIPMAVLIGVVVDRMIARRDSAASRLAWLVGAMLVVLPVLEITQRRGASLLLDTYTRKRAVPEDLEPGLLYLGLAAAFGLILLASAAIRSRWLLGGLVVVAVALGSYASSVLVPAVSDDKTMKNLCGSWRTLRASEAPLGFYGGLKHGIFFYTENRIQRFTTVRQAVDFLDPVTTAFSIVQKNRLPALESAYSKAYGGRKLVRVDESHRDFALVANRAVARGEIE